MVSRLQLRAAASSMVSPAFMRPPRNHQSGCGSTLRLPSIALPCESVRNMSAQPLTKTSRARLYSTSSRKVLLRVYVPVT